MNVNSKRKSIGLIPLMLFSLIANASNPVCWLTQVSEVGPNVDDWCWGTYTCTGTSHSSDAFAQVAIRGAYYWAQMVSGQFNSYGSKTTVEGTTVYGTLDSGQYVCDHWHVSYLSPWFVAASNQTQSYGTGTQCW